VLTKFDILKKSECLIFQTGSSIFYSYEMINISKWRSALCILQVGPYMHIFQVIHVFLRYLVEFHSRNKEVLQTRRILPGSSTRVSRVVSYSPKF
jgi:hypothetical protein